MPSDPGLIAVLYVSSGISALSREYFWRIFPLAICVLVFTISDFQELPFSVGTFVVWGPTLVILSVLVLVLSPLQLLFPPERRNPLVSIEILYDPQRREDGEDTQLELGLPFCMHGARHE